MTTPPKQEDYTHAPYVAMAPMEVANRVQAYPGDTAILDNETAKKEHVTRLKEVLSLTIARHKMEWLQNLPTDESAAMIAACRRKILAMSDHKTQLAEIDRALTTASAKYNTMQQHAKEHQEILDRLQRHLEAQKTCLHNLEQAKEEIRATIRAQEDAQEALRKARQPDATTDAYGGRADDSSSSPPQSSPFAVPSASTPSDAPFTKANSPFLDNADFQHMRSHFEAKFSAQEQRSATLEHQVGEIHTMLLRMASMQTPAPAPTTPPTATAPANTTPTGGGQVGPTGTPVASPTGATDSARLPTRTSPQDAAHAMAAHRAREERASAAQTSARAARAASVEAKRQAPPPPDVNAEPTTAAPADVQLVDSDDDCHYDGTGAGIRQ